MHEEEKLVFELMIWCREGAGERGGEGRRGGVWEVGASPQIPTLTHTLTHSLSYSYTHAGMELLPRSVRDHSEADQQRLGSDEWCHPPVHRSAHPRQEGSKEGL